MANINLSTSTNGGSIRVNGNTSAQSVKMGEATMPKYVGARAVVDRVENGVRITLTDYKGTTQEIVADSSSIEIQEVGDAPTRRIQITTPNGTYNATRQVEDNSSPVGWSINRYLVPLATSSSQGAMSDTDKAKLDSISSGAEANVQSDWNEADSSSDAYIKNKPSLSTVATSGSYSDLLNKPSLATVATSGSYSDLSNKPTIHNVPSGGSSGQVLAKTSGTDYDVAWKNAGISDVQINGSSIVSSGVADIPLADYNVKGAVEFSVSTEPGGHYASIKGATQNGNNVGVPYVRIGNTEYTILPKYLPYATQSDCGAMSPQDKTKLDGISSGAEANVQSDWSESDNTSDAYIANKPTNVSSFTNDAGYLTSFTETDPTVPSWAKQSSKPSYTFAEIGSKPSTISGYGITDAYTKTEIDGLVSGILHYKGTKATVSALPSTGNVTGDTWHVTADGSEWAWDGATWQELGTAVDLSGYVPTSRKINGKALTSDITLSASDVSALPSSTSIPSKTSDLTNDSNFVADASYVHTDNNFTSTEKSKLSGIASGAEVNVQADWNVTSTSSDAYIKNKPTIPTVPTNVSAFTNDAGYITLSDLPIYNGGVS